MATKPLTDKQQQFVEQYLIDLNGTQAAIRAGYSERTANEQAARLLANVNVSQAVAAAMAARSERTRIDADFVLNGLRDEAVYRGKGSSHAARVSAYGLLGKHLGLFVDRLDVTGGGTLRLVKEIVVADGDADGAAVPAAGPVPD